MNGYVTFTFVNIKVQSIPARKRVSVLLPVYLMLIRLLLDGPVLYIGSTNILVLPISGSTGCTPTSNYGGCDQICLPSGNTNQKRCACATGFVLKSDGTGCKGEYFLQQLPVDFFFGGGGGNAVHVVENAVDLMEHF